MIALLASTLACSDEDIPNSSGPAQRVRGRIAVSNNSAVAIELTEYHHIRGDIDIMIALGVHLFPDNAIQLHNMIDDGGSLFFKGGDVVKVHFQALVGDPDAPGEPLFQNTVDLIVNGSVVIQVKDGGDFGISPE
jgi:hypothetical protein